MINRRDKFPPGTVMPEEEEVEMWYRGIQTL